MRRSATPSLLALLLTFWMCGQRAGCAISNAMQQASDAAKSAGNTLPLPADTAILAKLVSQLDTKHAKIGDRVEAQITQDVKAGDQAVIKKGARVTGQISKLQTTPEAGGLYGVGIVFENVAPKKGDLIRLHLEIQAIAPPPNQGIDTVSDRRGTDGLDTIAAGGGHVGAMQHVEDLTAKSKGAIDLPGVDLGFEVNTLKSTRERTSLF